MKLRTLIFSTAILTSLIFYSCDPYRNCVKGDSHYITETRIIEDSFSGIEMEGSFNVFVKKDSVTSVNVKADSNLLPYIVTRVRSNRLLINTDAECLKTDRTIDIYVRTPNIDQVWLDGSGVIEVDSMNADYVEIELNGSGEIFVDDIFAEKCNITHDGSGIIDINTIDAYDDVFLKLLGSGELYTGDIYANYVDIIHDGSGEIQLLNIDAIELSTDHDGSGKITLAGYTDFTNFSISGSGTVNAFRLSQVECETYISGSGIVYTFVIDHLFADISGSGLVYYKGSPRRVTISVDTDERQVIAN